MSFPFSNHGHLENCRSQAVCAPEWTLISWLSWWSTLTFHLRISLLGVGQKNMPPKTTVHFIVTQNNPHAFPMSGMNQRHLRIMNTGLRIINTGLEGIKVPLRPIQASQGLMLLQGARWSCFWASNTQFHGVLFHMPQNLEVKYYLVSHMYNPRDSRPMALIKKKIRQAVLERKDYIATFPHIQRGILRWNDLFYIVLLQRVWKYYECWPLSKK